MKKFILRAVIIFFTAIIILYIMFCICFQVSPLFMLTVYAPRGEWQYKSDDIQMDFTVDIDTENYTNGICHINKDGISKEYDMKLNYFSCIDGAILIWERCAGDAIENSVPGHENTALWGYFKMKLNKDIYFYNIKEVDIENVWNNKSEIVLKKIR